MKILIVVAFFFKNFIKNYILFIKNSVLLIKTPLTYSILCGEGICNDLYYTIYIYYSKD